MLTNAEAEYVAQLAFVSATALVSAALLVVALHKLSPELDPVTRALSDYSNGRYGILMLAAFGGFACSLFVLAYAFSYMVSSDPQRIGVFLLAAAGVCVLMAGIFPADNTPDGSFNSLVGLIHAVVGHLLSPLAVLAMLLLSAPWGQVGANDALPRLAFGLAVLNLFAFAALVLVNTVVYIPVGGLGQRIFLFLIACWLFLASLRFMTAAAST
jgi:hypothetical membrane protein